MGEALIVRRGGGGIDGLIPMFFQGAAPSTDRIGAIWVKMASTPTGRILISYDVPSSPPWTDGDFWLRTFTGTSDIANLEIDLTTKKTQVFATKGTNPWQVIDGKNISLSMKHPNNALHRENGVWVAYESYFWSGSDWEKLTEDYNYLYNSGVEMVSFDQVARAGSYTAFGKEDDHMFIEKNERGFYGRVTASSDVPVNLSGVSSIIIDCDIVSGNTSTFALLVHPDKDSAGDAYTARLHLSGANYSRREHELDVSSLSGDYYVKLYIDCGSNNTRFVKVYNIYLIYT